MLTQPSSRRTAALSRAGAVLRLRALLPLLLLLATLAPGVSSATPLTGSINIVGPAGSGNFGEEVAVLPNGNLVITDPLYDEGSTADVGAVYLYDGNTLQVISRLTGSTGGDLVGSGGVAILSNGNYVVMSPVWDNGTIADAGAVTWADGTRGTNGVVSAANSLVGSSTEDFVGLRGVTPLSNGNYVVRSPEWNNGAATAAGAVTWGNGTAGTSGVVSAANSLVGTTASDIVGSENIIVLSNGNYVVHNPYWDNGTLVNAGAVTWGNGATGTSGAVSAANSLVGTTAGDSVAWNGITKLSNGNYVVHSPYWDNGTLVNAGAVTWGNGATGTRGIVSAANSLVGSAASDRIGLERVTALSNGNYVVRSPWWNNGGIADAGAVTWADGTRGITGTISITNSLVGNIANGMVGYKAVTELSNGNYVVSSPFWDNGTIANAGAVTWGDGATGITGTISTTNSLVGSSSDDRVGSDGVAALSNGNYVVHSPFWDSATAKNVGAVTWVDGRRGITGNISAANSLVGSSSDDWVGSDGVAALSNGNYVVHSPFWDSTTAENAGAVTWGDGASGTRGVVSAANSLVGGSPSDYVGIRDVVPLSNGNYVVHSPLWDNGTIIDAGAVTWADGRRGITGNISAANSLVGSSAYDRIGGSGESGVTALRNGNYVVSSPIWNNGTIINVGAVTWGDGTTGMRGIVSAANSLVGNTAEDMVGSGGVTVLSNGNYVVHNRHWDHGSIADAGAVTWGNGASGTRGIVSAVNSLVGASTDDMGGSGVVTALSSGHYVMHNPRWDNGTLNNAGAVTWGNGATGTRGIISACNSVPGGAAGGGWAMHFAYDVVHSRLVVERPTENMVSLFAESCALRLPLVAR